MRLNGIKQDPDYYDFLIYWGTLVSHILLLQLKISIMMLNILNLLGCEKFFFNNF